jgi:hypothetical protein
MIAAASSGVSLLQSAVVAALVAAAVSLTTLWVTERRTRQDRQRQLFAEAFEACIAYREFAYIVRRRANDSAEERVRISGALSGVQQRLRAAEARLRVEAPRVAVLYSLLIASTRRVAGVQIKRGWEMAPLALEETGNIIDVDFSSLAGDEDAYLRAVRDHLSLVPSALRFQRALPRTPSG